MLCNKIAGRHTRNRMLHLFSRKNSTIKIASSANPPSNRAGGTGQRDSVTGGTAGGGGWGACATVGDRSAVALGFAAGTAAGAVPWDVAASMLAKAALERTLV